MKLRSCDHVHFIQAVKSGLVVKSLNVSRGMPAVKYKTLTEIYETSDPTKCDFLLKPKKEVEQLFHHNNMVKVESPNLRYAVKRKIKVEPDASECTVDVDDESNNDLEDLCFGNMTLKQLKDKCKIKKRKLSKCIDFSMKTAGTFSPAKEECFVVEGDKGDCDLMEPLIRLKSKVSKKGKAKGKHLKKDLSFPSQTAVSVIKSEEAGLEDLVNSSMHVRIKSEAPEPALSEIENKNCFAGDFSLVCMNQMGSCGIGLQEVSELNAEHGFGIGISSPFPEEPQCCVNELYDSIPLSEGPQRCIVNESYDLIPINETPEWCVLNESYHDIMEYADLQPLQVVNTLLEDSKDVDVPEITSSQCSDLLESETKMDGYLTYSVGAEIFSEPEFSADDHHYNICSNFKTIKSEDKIRLHIERNAEIRLPDMALQNFLQHKGSGVGSDASASEDDARVDLHVVDSSLYLDCILVSSTNDSPPAKGQQSQKHVCADAERKCFPEILHHDALNDASFDSGYDHYSKSKHPERLCQSRKSISPESQEKLCKAMESVELDKEAYYISGRAKKLCLGKYNENRTEINGDEEPDQNGGVKLAIDSEQIIMKSKTQKKLFHSKDEASQVSTVCTSGCSRSAIAFSQRQMQDIESLATKLTSELKTMKEIAEERLLSAACPNTSLRYNTNKVRMAIKNATRAEQSAKKWLYMMSRDCNRFCKIMRLTEKGSNFSESLVNQESATIVNKEKRKISFADEAGEKLCHVRYFENELTSSMESDNGKSEVQA